MSSKRPCPQRDHVQCPMPPVQCPQRDPSLTWAQPDPEGGRQCCTRSRRVRGENSILRALRVRTNPTCWDLGWVSLDSGLFRQMLQGWLAFVEIRFHERSRACGMPHPPRLQYPGASYHLVTRGDGRRTLFHDDRFCRCENRSSLGLAYGGREGQPCQK